MMTINLMRTGYPASGCPLTLHAHRRGTSFAVDRCQIYGVVFSPGTMLKASGAMTPSTSFPVSAGILAAVVESLKCPAKKVKCYSSDSSS